MIEKATFGAGCFWGVEAAFRELDGVVDSTVGHEGGHTEKPTYKQVCTDGTGHAEVVEVNYDPAKVSYDRLLSLFWNEHDPTQVNRQGPDIGTQYRSVIFYHTPEQERAARASPLPHLGQQFPACTTQRHLTDQRGAFLCAFLSSRRM